MYFNNTNNYFVCDSDDWIKFKDYTWFESERGYSRASNKNGKFIFFHDMVMNFSPSNDIVCDHIDRNRLNNKKSNLRIVNRQCNSINRSIHKNNTSGFVGVYFANGKWTVYISKKYIGSFSTFEEAVSARMKAEREYFKGMKYYGDQTINR